MPKNTETAARLRDMQTAMQLIRRVALMEQMGKLRTN